MVQVWPFSGIDETDVNKNEIIGKTGTVIAVQFMGAILRSRVAMEVVE